VVHVPGPGGLRQGRPAEEGLGEEEEEEEAARKIKGSTSLRGLAMKE
jgi:hypothetical protein